MSDVKLVASLREKFGKGSARQARRDGKIPAVVYSHGGEAKSLLLDAHETFLVIKNHRNALINIDIDGKAQKAIIKDIQRDAIGRVIEHVDFLAVKANEKQVVEVPVVLTGEANSGVVPQLELHKLNVEAVVSALPEHVEVSVEGLEAGTVVYVKDLKLPKGQAAANDPEQVVLVLNELAAEPAEDTDTEATAEPAAE